MQNSSQIITTNKPTSSFFTGPSCHPTNSVKALSLTCIVTYTFSVHIELQYHANALYQL